MAASNGAVRDATAGTLRASSTAVLRLMMCPWLWRVGVARDGRFELRSGVTESI
jgi:hypothetical protein